MIDGKKIVALVPLRGGSKSIPRKNIKEIAGKPLCQWILEALLQIDNIDGVYVSTEDSEIAQVVRSISPEITIIERPEELATDDASTESVMLHLAEKIEFDVLITAQATSPLTKPQDIRRGIEVFFEGGYDSLLTGVRVKRFYWKLEKGDVSPINYDYKQRPRRQDSEGWIMENGAFYVTSLPILLREESRLGGRIGILEMDESTSIEIDESGDWRIVESLLIERKRLNLLENLPDIKLLVIDVDGTLTDAGMYYSHDGELLKKFNTRDAKGLELVRKKGIVVAIMTSEDSDIVRARAEKMGLEHVLCGIEDKMAALEKLCRELDIDLPETAFIGDDLNDLACIGAVGLGACPADALDEVKNSAVYLCRRNGGSGAVRELCELLLETRRNSRRE